MVIDGAQEEGRIGEDLGAHPSFPDSADGNECVGQGVQTGSRLESWAVCLTLS